MRLYTEKELADMGYVETSPGIFERAKPNSDPVKKQKKIPDHLKHIKSGNYEVGGIIYHFRSKWEYIYASYLSLLKLNGSIKDWEYESPACRFTFDKIKRGTTSYLIDFRIVENDGSERFVEVKGFLDKKSATKLKRMGIYHPTVKIELVRKEGIEEIRSKFGLK